MIDQNKMDLTSRRPINSIFNYYYCYKIFYFVYILYEINILPELHLTNINLHLFKMVVIICRRWSKFNSFLLNFDGKQYRL